MKIFALEVLEQKTRHIISNTHPEAGKVSNEMKKYPGFLFYC